VRTGAFDWLGVGSGSGIAPVGSSPSVPGRSPIGTVSRGTATAPAAGTRSVSRSLSGKISRRKLPMRAADGGRPSATSQSSIAAAAAAAVG